jgi:hypothetical protein
MAYNAVTDFMALLRQTSGGPRMARIPGLDYVLAAMARAGMFLLSVSATEPTTNQAATVWLQPSSQGSENAESSVFLWNSSTAEYEPATPQLWASVLSSQVVQEIVAGSPVPILENAGIVKVNQTVSAPITLIMPLSDVKVGGVLVSDYKGVSGANPITVQMSGTNKLPGNLTSWVIQGDGASAMFRPVPGGFVL